MRSRFVLPRKPALHRAGFCVCVLLLPCAVFAQVTQTSDYLARMDVDGDGRVALVEYQDWMSYAFDAMDRDRDGVLATEELPGGRGQPVSREAHRARLAETFKRQDGNRDGFLNAKELAAPPQ
jgi:EF hand domain-containing protein